jgi:hypothetical protein
VTNGVLTHISLQIDTTICCLEKISKQTCELLNFVNQKVTLQKRMQMDTALIRQMYETIHPGGALEVRRLHELREEIEKCCPPPAEPAICDYKPCPTPPPLHPDHPPI